ncbi:MAG TPA: 4Fe-4S dicluster domain-containing protein [Candidatus Binataceae bacterium]|nr:4Fe-4S dicluster domain-containing protein [Candidatus Binataceae bacterium]
MGLGILLGKRTARGYRPSLIYRLLKPRISGNTINGLGEEKRRRASPIYHWAELGFPHKRVWRLFLLLEMRSRKMTREVREALRQRRTPPTPIARERAQDAPANWAARVKQFALDNEADLVGITPLNPDWVFEPCSISEPWVIVLGVKMDYEQLATAPEAPSGIEVLRQYNRGHRAATKLSSWIRSQGWNARGFGVPFATPLVMIPAAIAAGLGELGKHGSLINRELGSSFRLAYVLTDLPLVADRPDHFGVDEFCTNCRLCTAQCPPQAIYDSKQMVRGDFKWYVDFDKCVPYFNDTYGCGICLAACPWSRPGVAVSLAEKMTRKLARQEKSAASR